MKEGSQTKEKSGKLLFEKKKKKFYILKQVLHKLNSLI